MTADRLDGARRLLRAAAGTVATGLLLLALLSTAGTGRDPRPGLAAALGLTALAAVPPGQPLRAPEARLPAVDPRQDPALPAPLEPALSGLPGR